MFLGKQLNTGDSVKSILLAQAKWARAQAKAQPKLARAQMVQAPRGPKPKWAQARVEWPNQIQDLDSGIEVCPSRALSWEPHSETQIRLHDQVVVLATINSGPKHGCSYV